MFVNTKQPGLCTGWPVLCSALETEPAGSSGFAEGRRLRTCGFLGCKSPKAIVQHQAAGGAANPRECGPGSAMQCAGCTAGCMDSKRPARPALSLHPANQPPTNRRGNPKNKTTNQPPTKGRILHKKTLTNRGGHLLKKNHQPTKGGIF